MGKIIYRYKTSRWTYLCLILGLITGVMAVIMVSMGEAGVATINGFASGMNLMLAVWSDKKYL